MTYEIPSTERFFTRLPVRSFIPSELQTAKMSAKHLGKGSLMPPFSGKLRVYSMRFCPYAHRTILMLNAKKLDYEVVNIDLMKKPEWLTTKSPLGKVPSLEIEENVAIYESLITAEYLEDKYPLPKLVSSDPLRKAQDKLIVENFSALTVAYHKAVYAKEEVNEAVISQFYRGLEALQGEMTKRGSKFLGGASPGMVDYMIWPWFERFGVLPKLGETRFNIDEKKFSVLHAWIEAMRQDPAVIPHFLDLDTHFQYLQTKLSGQPDYDMLEK